MSKGRVLVDFESDNDVETYFELRIVKSHASEVTMLRFLFATSPVFTKRTIKKWLE